MPYGIKSNVNSTISKSIFRMAIDLDFLERRYYSFQLILALKQAGMIEKIQICTQ